MELVHHAKADLVPGETLGSRNKLIGIPAVLMHPSRCEVDAVEDDGEVLVDVVGCAHIELAIGCRVYRLVVLVGLVQCGQERSAMTVSHAGLEAPLLKEPHEVVRTAQARQCELRIDCLRVPGGAAGRYRPVGLQTKAAVTEYVLHGELKSMGIGLVAIGRRRHIPNDQRVARLPQEWTRRSGVSDYLGEYVLRARGLTGGRQLGNRLIGQRSRVRIRDAEQRML